MFHSRTQRQVMVVIVLLAVPSAWSQANTGTISGEIRDPSAAVVVGARVRLIDVQTGVERQGLSNDEGFYKVALVPAGTYRMVTEASGFKSVEVQNIHIDVNQNLTIPVTLEIGQTSESISVT